MKKKTQLIHGGIVGDENTGAVSVPNILEPATRHDMLWKYLSRKWRKANADLLLDQEWRQ
jgi:hypothetical protein